MKYFVIGLRKIKTPEEYKNKVVGHNHRKRNYKKNLHNNINPERTPDNIILQDLKYKNAAELIKAGDGIRAKGKRKLKKGSAFAYEVIVDCTPDESWTEQDYINYLKKAESFLKERFAGQEVISSVIHMDESKPHLHVVFSYFNEELGQWNQRNLMKEKKTNLNDLLRDFEQEVGKEFGLHRGKGKEIDKPFKRELEKYQKTIETRKFIFFKEQHKVIETKDAVKAIKNLNNRYKKAIYENENLKQKLIESNNKIKKLETYKNDFLSAVQRIKELEKELQEKDKKIDSLEKQLQSKENEISQLEQALLREREKRLNIKSQFPKRTIKKIREDHGI
jgi:hypothetical protein